MTVSEFKSLAHSFPGVEEHPHFERRAFKVTEKRIFATIHEAQGSANVKLPPADQSIFCKFDPKGVYPVPNKWGLQGWTTFELKKIPAGLMLDALNTAYRDVVKPKASKK